MAANLHFFFFFCVFLVTVCLLYKPYCPKRNATHKLQNLQRIRRQLIFYKHRIKSGQSNNRIHESNLVKLKKKKSSKRFDVLEFIFTTQKQPIKKHMEKLSPQTNMQITFSERSWKRSPIGNNYMEDREQKNEIEYYVVDSIFYQTTKLRKYDYHVRIKKQAGT